MRNALMGNVGLTKLKREVEDIRVMIGVKNEIIEKQLAKLNKLGINTIKEAEQAIIDIEEKIKVLENRAETLKLKAEKILNRIK